MIRIFIDANVLLRFYDSNRSEYKKLIYSLDAFAEHFYITSQVADEVIRNRLAVAVQAARNIEKELQQVAKIALPEHFEIPAAEGVPTAKQWNEELTEFRRKHKELSSNLHAYFSVLLSSVSEGSDNVSVTLDRLFAKAIRPSAEQISEAKERKTFGNPPGKRADPVGDQLSWILVRDTHVIEDKLWLVTNDCDYYEKFSSKCYLNSFLVSELRRKLGKLPDIDIFTDLSEAIRELQLQMKREVVPAETLAKAHDEAVQLPVRDVYHGLPTRCPQCGSHNSMIEENIGPSQYGGWSYWYICIRCGFRLDSGVPYDE